MIYKSLLTIRKRQCAQRVPAKPTFSLPITRVARTIVRNDERCDLEQIAKNLRTNFQCARVRHVATRTRQTKPGIGNSQFSTAKSDLDVFSGRVSLSQTFARARAISGFHNCARFKFRLLHAIQERNFLEFYDNNTRITGLCGDLWTILSQTLNFT